MRCWLLLPFLLVACGGSGGDDITGDDDDGPVDGEPPGLEGTTAAHNDARSAHGVAPLEWDPALAAIAQGWADQCVDAEAPTGLIDHNPNRSDTYPVYVGENIYGASSGATGVDAVALWVAEEADYDYDSNTCNGICGHYTQVVWAATTKLGCGIRDCAGLQFGSTVVCDYGPGGNDGGRPY